MTRREALAALAAALAVLVLGGRAASPPASPPDPLAGLARLVHVTPNGGVRIG